MIRNVVEVSNRSDNLHVRCVYLCFPSSASPRERAICFCDAVCRVGGGGSGEWMRYKLEIVWWAAGVWHAIPTPIGQCAGSCATRLRVN